MDTLMMAVTGLSLAMAIGMGLVLAKLVREERQRSDARVAALTEMAAEPAPLLRSSAGAAGVSDDPRRQRLTPEPSRAQGAGVRRPVVAARPARGVRLDELEIRPAHDTATGVAELFTARQGPSVWGGRLAVVGVLAIVAAAVVFGIRSSDVRSDAPAAAAPAGDRVTTGAPPLELLSLRHTQQAGSLTITGLVQNPGDGSPLTRVVATALVFRPEGTLLSSARAPLDFTTIAPGDESPFVVTVPVTGEVTRYRIGFRSADGRVIAHVDKRGPDALASR